MLSRSSSSRRAASSNAAHSTRSSRLRGNRRPFGVAPRWWPERPTRCRNTAMERGEPSWQTRSISPISIPSSREAVATRALSSPRFNRCSAFRRCSFARLPWWAVTFSSPTRSARARAARSARRRVFTKISVVLCLPIKSASRPYNSCHTSPAITASRGESVSSRAISICLVWPRSRMLQWTSRLPTRNRAISSMGLCVADKPMRTGVCSASASSRSSDNARCAPRLFGARAWISSTITLRTVCSMFLPELLVSRI